MRRGSRVTWWREGEDRQNVGDVLASLERARLLTVLMTRDHPIDDEFRELLRSPRRALPAFVRASHRPLAAWLASTGAPLPPRGAPVNFPPARAPRGRVR